MWNFCIYICGICNPNFKNAMDQIKSKNNGIAITYGSDDED